MQTSLWITMCIIHGYNLLIFMVFIANHPKKLGGKNTYIRTYINGHFSTGWKNGFLELKWMPLLSQRMLGKNKWFVFLIVRSLKKAHGGSKKKHQTEPTLIWTYDVWHLTACYSLKSLFTSPPCLKIKNKVF